MAYSNQSDLQDLLAAVTDALLAEEKHLDHILRQYNTSPQQAAGFIMLIQRLQRTLVGVQPSKRFVRRLKQDLIAIEQYNVITRVRRLPARVQIAAGIALIAGFMLISRRRVHDLRMAQEAAALQ